MCRGEEAVALSFDHKPTDPEERARIIKANGYVTEEGRVDGNLNLSRALGDLTYKKDKNLPPEEQKISGVPDITVTPINKKTDNFVVVGCDGIWERYSNQQMVDFVRDKTGELLDIPMPYT